MRPLANRQHPLADRQSRYSVDVYDDRTLERDWQQLIEDHPDRFVVGVDLAANPQDYEASMQAIRNGLRANLTPATAEKVARRNAEAWFGLR